jgi:hypothetical protein
MNNNLRYCENNCDKCARITSLIDFRVKYYCSGVEISSDIVNWLKVVGCASFGDDKSGCNTE